MLTGQQKGFFSSGSPVSLDDYKARWELYKNDHPDETKISRELNEFILEIERAGRQATDYTLRANLFELAANIYWEYAKEVHEANEHKLLYTYFDKWWQYALRSFKATFAGNIEKKIPELDKDFEEIFTSNLSVDEAFTRLKEINGLFFNDKKHEIASALEEQLKSILEKIKTFVECHITERLQRAQQENDDSMVEYLKTYRLPLVDKKTDETDDSLPAQAPQP